MLILSGLREDLIGVTMFPAALNTRSDGVLVAQMHFKQPWPGILPHYSTDTKQAGSLASSRKYQMETALEIWSARPFNT